MRTIFRYSNIPFLLLEAKRPRWRQVWDPFAIPVLGSEANGVKIETTYARPRAFTFRPGFRRRFRCACLLFNYPGMRFLALSAPADPDVDPPRASLQRIRFCPFLRFSNCTETDVPPRNFTAIEHRQRATERAGDPLCRDFFMHGQRARMEKAQRFLALAHPPPSPLCIPSEMKISTLLHALGRVFPAP